MMHIIGLSTPDDKWNQMKAVYNSCTEAGIPIPDVVLEYFNGINPNQTNGLIHDFTKNNQMWKNDDLKSIGYDIAVDSIPKGIKTIRVFIQTG